MVKISALPLDSTPDSTDYIIVNDTTSSNTKKVLLSALNTTKLTTIFNETAGIVGVWTNATTTFSDVTNWTGGSITTTGGDVIFHIELSYWKGAPSAGQADFRLVLNTTNYYPSSAGWRVYTNETASHKYSGRTILVSGLAAGTYTVKIQGANASGTDRKVDSGDYLRITAVEYII